MKNKKLLEIFVILLTFCLPVISVMSTNSTSLNPIPKLSTSTISESEDFSGETHGTKGLDIEFIDEYLGYASSYYCDQYIHDGPFGDHTKVLIMRDAQGGKNTWSVHYLENSYRKGTIEFSLSVSSGSRCTNPNYHYIKFRDESNNIAFQLRFDLYSKKAYYYTGSEWSLMAILSQDEWYHYSINFNMDLGKFNIEIFKEDTSKVVCTLNDLPYENNVLIEEFFLTTVVSHYHGNTKWDDFFIAEDPNAFFESQLYSDILSVDIQKGKDYEGDGNVNTLEDLKYIDENKYELEGEWDAYQNEYLIEVYFSFGANLECFALDYYDLFLFLNIDALDFSGESLEFQAYSTYQWVTVTTVSDSDILLNRHYLERSTEFRIIGQTIENPHIKIDKIRLNIAHEGNIGPTFKLENYLTNYEMLLKNPASGYIEDNLWWEELDDEVIGHHKLSQVWWGAASAIVESQVRMFIDFPDEGTITSYIGTDIDARYSYRTYTSSLGAPPHDGYSNSYIKDMDAGAWTLIQSYGYSNTYVDKEDSWFIGGTSLDNQYIDYDSTSDVYYFDLRFRTYSWIDWWAFVTQTARSDHYIDEIDCSIEVEGYGFDDYDYPSMDVDRQTDYYFEINTNGKFLSSSIDSVEFLLQNDTYYSEWQPATYNNGKWIMEIDRYDYTNGIYNIWIKSTDENGYSSYESHEIEIQRHDSPLYWEGPIDGETIIFNCTTPETAGAILDINVYIDEDYFDEEIKLYIDNGIGNRVDRTPQGGLVNGNNSINLEPYSTDVNGNIMAIIECTDRFGVTHSHSRNFIFRKMISAETIEYERGVDFIGNQLYAIIYDPNGDRSWSSFAITEAHSYLFEIEIGSGLGINFNPSIPGGCVGFHFSFDWEFMGNLIRVSTETVDTTSITSTTSWSATSSSTGPGRGDTYWGEALYLPYYTTAVKAEFWGAEGSYDYVNPTLHYGLNFTGEIIGGPNEVPSEWVEQNYVLQAEENGGIFPESANINWTSPIDGGLGNKTVFGGGRDLDHTHSDKHLTDFSEMTHSININLGPKYASTTIDIKFKFKSHERIEDTETITRRYHMEDFDFYDDVLKGDEITNRIGIDNRFGTYIFQTISDACFTSDPWEYNTNDWRPPIIGTPDINLDSNNDGIAPCADDEPIVTVDIEDECEIQSAYIKYSYDGGLIWNTATLTEYPADPGTWEGSIPSFPRDITVLWYIEAIDLFENIKNKTDGWGNPFSYTIINSAPVVTLLTPEDASTHYDTLYISWSAEDLDNDNLTFTLSYTINGVTKYLIESGITEFSYDWDISGLGSLDVLIIVEVFDGIVTMEDRNEYIVYLNP